MDDLLPLLILIIYLSVLIIIGVISSRKIKNYQSFFLANRSLNIFALTATLTATVIGGSATVAAAKLIYLNGLPAIWLDIGAATGLIILGLCLAKIVRKTGLITLPEIIGHLFDRRVRYAAAFLIIITQMTWISLLIQGSSAILAVLLPIGYTNLLILITIIFIIYTIIGGQFAVVYTDIIQFFVMIFGVCIIAAPILFLRAQSIADADFIGTIEFPINSNIGFLPILSMFFMMMMPNMIGPDVYSKILSARDEKTARYGAVFSGIFRIIFAICIAIIALSAIFIVPDLPPEEAVLAMPKAVKQLGPILGGTILAAFISVMLSSADSVLISAGTILSVDIFRKKKILISRIGMIFIGIIALLLALYLNDIIKTLTLAYTLFTAGLTIPILFGFYKERTRTSTNGALISLIFGGMISLIWFFFNNPYNIDAVIIGMIVSVSLLLIFREGKNEKKNT
jgi:SSS family solute:Na+ symporter